MSISRRCDVCDTRYGKWHFRKRWAIFQIFTSFMGDEWKNEEDYCDDCIDHFKNWVRRQKSWRSKNAEIGGLKHEQ